MVDNVVEGYQLSAVELRSMTDWPSELIDDWLELVRSVNVLLRSSTQTFAGNPNSNVTSNASLLCIDTTGPTLYMNPTLGVDTGWVAV